MKNIIACIDGSPMTIATCEASAWVASKINAPLILLHALDKTTRPVVSEFSGQIGLGSQEELLNELAKLDEARSKVALKHGKQLLEEAAEWVMNKGISHVEQLQRHGSLLESLIDLENELRVLVIGKLGEEQDSNKTIGSQLESVIRSIKSHTLVVNAPFSIPTSYLIAFDGSPTSEKLIEKAINTPLLLGLDCHLVMVDDFAEKSAAFEKAAIKLKNAGLSVHEDILSGSVDDALLKYQKDHQIGMMVMGAYGHSTLRQFFLGSNTTKVLIKSEVPLLLIR
ncbi:universal stress protein UspA [Aliivibrio sp. 1S165]|uniref:universal stress protein n=1 Tax=unclassified Aliivibrio TaxID=2645654 RepID=UPI00080E42E6|nr:MULTISPECIES: universal stress protein [unclassified Aliivibrio]OCH17476.1 universal stress protein UspA [Aliivibrio sp. 1S165]OCH34469.1 universal stress protein UspA [Aliivibrio sp. 1S175]